MRRRAVLRALAGGTAVPAAVGLGLRRAVGTAAAHPTPTGGRAGAGETTPTASGLAVGGRLELPGAKELVAAEGVAYVATTDGFATVDVSDPGDPTLLARRDDLLADHPDGPLRFVYDGKLGGDYYAVGGPANPRDEVPYAAVVLDVADPADPRPVLTHETGFHIHNLDIDGETLYLCGNDGETNPLVCVDVASGEELGRWSVVDAQPRWADAWHKLFEFHDVQVVDDVAYCACWNAGTWLLDVADPADPTPITHLRGLDADEQARLGEQASRESRLTLPGNDHAVAPRRLPDGGVDPSLVAVNEEAWSTEVEAPASALGGVELWDVDAGERLSRIGALPTTDATYRGVWTTAHNFAWVGERLYTSWYSGGVRVHDVSEPTDPWELAHWRDDRTTSFWTAQPGADGVVLASSWRDDAREDPLAGAAVYAFEQSSETDEPDVADDSVADGAGFGTAAGLVGLGAASIGVEGVRRRVRARDDEHPGGRDPDGMDL